MANAIVLVAALLSVAAAISDPEWEQFKAKHKKTYTSDADEQARYKLFQESKERVKNLNELNGQPAFGINWMSDRHESEKHKRGHKKPAGFVPTAPVKKFYAPRNPPSINWRFTEAVTPIKNQGQCGSCWAFSATEAIESQMILGVGGKVSISLSPQQIASCTPSNGTYGCDGCNGGFTEGAYEYLKTVPGLANSFYIPYGQSLTETTPTLACPTKKVQQIDGQYQQLSGGFATVTGYSYAVPPCTQGACKNQDLKGFAASLEKSPLSICVNAGAWNDYTGGVMTSKACGPMGAEYQDHCVMATGFNTTAPTPYWIVRNSWASTFGEEGYIYLEMAENTCGLADDATIPEVKLDLTAEEAADAVILREAMYQRATQGLSKASTSTFDPEWEQFKAKHKKTYASDSDEKARHKLFQDSEDRVKKLNELNGQPAFGINWMSDRYDSEKNKRGHKKPAGFVPTAPIKQFDAPRSPASINWRYTEVVTPIKNQGQCGSCWAFSATEAIESQMILGIGGKVSISLSPQQIASCAPSNGTYGCDGCNGGFTEGAYEYLKTVPGLANSFYIPYEQSLTETTATKACPTKKVQQIDGQYQQLSGGFATVTGYSYAVKPCTEGACTNQDLTGFAAALEKTPLSVCVNAGAWNDYTGGVMTSKACGPMGAEYQDHCVMATGFNTTAPTPYWIVRNSWASTFGEDGYIYLEMAKNTCGLADDATIPEVKLDLTEEEAAKAAVLREAMYQRATQGGATKAAAMVI